MSGESLGGQAAKGAVWIYGRMLVVQATNLLAIAILARELGVRAFGLVALANLVVAFLNILASQGVNQFIIYDREAGHEDRAKAAFWLNLCIALATVGIGAATAPAISRFFEEPELAAIIWVLLLRFPLDAITRVADAVLQKDMRFKPIELRDTAIQMGAALGGVGMALAGLGVWSLVVPIVALSPIQAIVAYWASGWRPGWNPRFPLWPGILRYAASVIGSTFTSFLTTQGDTLLVGRLMGAGPLGIYNLAWRTSNLVCRNIVNLSSKLAFPVLASVSDQRERLVHTLSRLLRILSGVTFPLLIGLFVVADDFILTLYGDQWREVIPLLRILIIFAIRFSVGSLLNPVLKALGRPDLLFKVGLLLVPFYGASIWIGSAFGIVGVAAGVTVVRTSFGVLTFWVVARQLRVGLAHLLRPMASSLLAALAMGLLVFGAKWGWNATLGGPGPARLVVLTVVGGIAYVLLIRSWFRDLAEEFATVFQRLLRSRAGFVNRLLNVHPA